MKRKSFKLPIQLLELEENNYHLLIESSFQNGDEGLWVIDTGASKSVFDSRLNAYYSEEDAGEQEVKSAGIGEGHIETTAGSIANIRFGDFSVNNFKVALISLEHINELYGQFTDKKIVGLIGSDFLVEHKALINLKKKHIKLRVLQ